MFKENNRHLQPLLISNVSQLPEKQRKRLEESWAGTFYREFFSRIKEETFAVLYADIPSRPNVPVNLLVGLETLKSGFGWSDEEMYDAFTYDLQVRYALGYHELGEGYFDLRTLYYFRERLSRYNQKHGVNLLAQAFEDITDQQIMALHIRTGKQRMDSTQVASNILDASRLQLLVEAIQRLWRILSKPDQQCYQERFAPYLVGSSGQYVYRVKGKESYQEHLQQIGQFIQQLLDELALSYEQEAAYQVLQRFFLDNYIQEEKAWRPRENSEIHAGCLQSPDDLEATYRKKGNRAYKGYVANITETCDPDNPLQLVTSIQVAPNITEDTTLLVEVMSDLKARTDIDTLYTDGAFSNPMTDQVLQEQQVTHVQTAIRGNQPHPDKFSLADFQIEVNAEHQPVQLICPNNQKGFVRFGRQQGAFVVDLDPMVCQDCPFYLEQRCRAKPGKRDTRYHLDFNLHEVQVAKRRQASQAHRNSKQNLRAAIEATVRSIKHPFPASKLPCRGRFRVTSMLIGSAAMTNIQRIQRYWYDHSKRTNPSIIKTSGKKVTDLPFNSSFFSWFWSFAKQIWDFTILFEPCFNC